MVVSVSRACAARGHRAPRRMFADDAQAAMGLVEGSGIATRVEFRLLLRNVTDLAGDIPQLWYGGTYCGVASSERVHVASPSAAMRLQ